MNCTILQGDALELLRTLPPESVHTCVTSPPYYNLRDYGVEGQIGNEGIVHESRVDGVVLAWLCLLLVREIEQFERKIRGDGR